MRSVHSDILARLVSFAVVLWLIAGVLRGQPTQPGTLSIHVAWSELIRWEGHSLTPYRDGAGYSVGVGHSLSAHAEPVKARYTQTEVWALFLADLSWSLDSCRSGIRDFDSLPRDIQLVALGLAWNVGRTGFARFHDFRVALSYRSYESAAFALQTSRWYQQAPARRVNAYLGTLRSQH